MHTLVLCRHPPCPSPLRLVLAPLHRSRLDPARGPARPPSAPSAPSPAGARFSLCSTQPHYHCCSLNSLLNAPRHFQSAVPSSFQNLTPRREAPCVGRSQSSVILLNHARGWVGFRRSNPYRSSGTHMIARSDQAQRPGHTFSRPLGTHRNCGKIARESGPRCAQALASHPPLVGRRARLARRPRGRRRQQVSSAQSS